MKVVVAMSGGVDSSTTAALLVEQGHEVIGLAMKTHAAEPRQNRACCTPDDMRDARRVADLLDIPFYVLNYAELFREVVITPFAQAYRTGRTPNPCVVCNDQVKFRPLLERARLLGAERLATGHYARIDRPAGSGPWRLRRGADPHKDQSYFLYRLRPEQLREIVFPLGAMHKDEVRAHARRLGLPLAEKAESQEICFVGREGYAAVVEQTGGGGQRGHIVHTDGRILGEHDGIHHFTLGQRRGVGRYLAHSSPQPLYVCDIDPVTGDVRVGDAAALRTETIRIVNVVWLGAPPATDEIIAVQQRYRDRPRPARLVKHDAHGALIRFLQPEPRGAPGQAAVLYRDDQVLGGGSITRFHTRSQAPVLPMAAVS